jgi:hypothetical protein
MERYKVIMQNYKEKSFWLSSTDYQENEPLRDHIKTDVAIIGGGFTGLALHIF